jgi:hypothetical protein
VCSSILTPHTVQDEFLDAYSVLPTLSQISAKKVLPMKKQNLPLMSGYAQLAARVGGEGCASAAAGLPPPER